MYVPITASQFPADYPFLEQRQSSQNAEVSKQVASGGNGKPPPLVSDSGKLYIPPAPAAPVALVPVLKFSNH